MNSNDIKMILDKTNINVLDEINILEYIDELEKVKEDYIKLLDKLDVLENRNNKAIEYIESDGGIKLFNSISSRQQWYNYLLSILEGKEVEDNE